MKHDTYIKIASIVALESKCSRAKVGAVIAKDKRIVATGFNGTAKGTCNDCEKDGKTLPTVIHAELNAILNATTEDLNGTTLYVTLSPCLHCAALIKQKGIKNVYYEDEYRDITAIKWLNKNNVNCKPIL